MALDDTPTKRYGPKVQGAGIHHNPTPGPADPLPLRPRLGHPGRRRATTRCGGPPALPLRARLYVREKDIARFPARYRWPFRTKLELAAELLGWPAEAAAILGRAVEVVVDGVYAKKPFLEAPPSGTVTVFSRWRRDAALRTLPPPRRGQGSAAGRRSTGKEASAWPSGPARRRGWQAARVRPIRRGPGQADQDVRGDVAAGDYRIESSSPAHYFITQQDQGGDDTLDSDADPATGRTALFSLAWGQSTTSIDVGFFEAGDDSGMVWEDLDSDGVRETGETLLAGVDVELLDDAENVLDTVTTDSYGVYSFDDLMPGNYSVRVAALGDYVHTLPNAGSDDTTDSDADPMTGFASVTVLSGQTTDHTDLGMFVPITISGNVWTDLNATGLRETADTGIEDVLVTLLDTNSAGSRPIPTSDANGDYTWRMSRPARTPSSSPRPTATTSRSRITGLTTDSNIATWTARKRTVHLISSQADQVIDAGVFQLGIVSGRRWKDPDGDGIQETGEESYTGLTVRLLDSLDNEVDSTTTDSSGSYVFYVTPGDYRVEFEEPMDFFITLQNQGSDDALDSDIDSTTGRTAAAHRRVRR